MACAVQCLQCLSLRTQERISAWTGETSFVNLHNGKTILQAHPNLVLSATENETLFLVLSTVYSIGMQSLLASSKDASRFGVAFFLINGERCISLAFASYLQTRGEMTTGWTP